MKCRWCVAVQIASITIKTAYRFWGRTQFSTYISLIFSCYCLLLWLSGVFCISFGLFICDLFFEASCHETDLYMMVLAG